MSPEHPPRGIHAELTGSGETIVWIPGTAELGSIWSEHQTPAFADRYACVTVDLPGTGRSAQTEVRSVADFATALATWLDSAGGGPAHFVGFSLGAAVAQELAIARPELVSTLTLIGAWSSSSREHHIARHTQARLAALENASREVYGAYGYWMISPTLFDLEPQLREQVERELARHAADAPQVVAQQYRANLGHESYDRLERISCPTLVISGDEDLIALPRYGAAIADRIPSARFELIHRAGHLVILERPEEVNARIAEFLAETPCRARAWQSTEISR